MKRNIQIWITTILIFLSTLIPSHAQNQDRIQNCIRAHEFIDSRIFYEREQALAAVYSNAGYAIIGAWLSGGASILTTWGGIWDFGTNYNAYSIEDHRVAIDIIERLYWERTIGALQDLNNCINFS
ncbi:hypothetical protein [Aquirufa ecclesiirivi]|uniref:hypothetical protein n=1 Tax=Aquirufa ecclesiirivi TaxID=2715124 RepID=UPI003BAE88A4